MQTRNTLQIANDTLNTQKNTFSNIQFIATTMQTEVNIDIFNTIDERLLLAYKALYVLNSDYSNATDKSVVLDEMGTIGFLRPIPSGYWVAGYSNSNYAQ